MKKQQQINNKQLQCKFVNSCNELALKITFVAVKNIIILLCKEKIASTFTNSYAGGVTDGALMQL